jgi:immune inhibitor A
MARYFIVFILVGTIATSSIAMPPHPQNLIKIANGDAVVPLYMEDANYAARVGINKGLKEPAIARGASLANFNLLVVMVQYADQAGVTSGTMFDSLILGQTFHRGPSLKQFYNRASYGTLTLVTLNLPSSLGWKTLPHNRAYYTVNGGHNSYGMGSYPNNSQGMCEDMLNLVDPYVNLSNYDNNADDTVDGIIIVHSGRGSELSLDTLDMWSHKWEITPQLKDGVYIKYYCVDPEYRYVVNDLTVGVFAHEFGHILGLPDLYDYGGYNGLSYGLGYWSLMAYGGWNGNLGGNDSLAGSSPAFLDAWCRTKLGFVRATNIPCFVQNVHIPAVEDSAKVFRLWTYGDTTSLEYFLAENRQSIFTDTALHAFGLMIYHVDENMQDSVNDCQWWPTQPSAYHYMVALEQADNQYHLEHLTNGMDQFDPFATTANSSFGYNTVPSSRNYYNNDTHVSMPFISISQYNMLADMDVGATAAPNTPDGLIPTDGYATNYDLVGGAWLVALCATKYHAQMDDSPSMTTPLYNDSTLVYNYFQRSLHSNPDGYYYWRVRAGNTSGWSSWTTPRSIMLDRKLPWNCVASSPDTAHSSSFLVTWTAGQDSTPSSGICSYDLWCDSGSGWWNVFFQRDTLSHMFTGARNSKTYYFKARARDCAFNMEVDGWTPECTTYTNITAPPCSYMPGDINSDGQRIGGDVTYGVRYFKGIGPNPPDSCYMDSTSAYLYVAGDVNGNCEFRGSDITRLVAYFKSTATLSYCHFFPPPILKEIPKKPAPQD